MTTFEQIQYNLSWFKAQQKALDERAVNAEKCQAGAQCLQVKDDDWVDALKEFKIEYDRARGLLYEGSTAYRRGAESMKALARSLYETGRAYAQSEAASNEAIRSQIDQLLKDY